MQKLASRFCLFVSLAGGALSTSAQTNSVCSAFLNKPIFTNSTVTSNSVATTTFKALQCSSQWKSAGEAQAAGVEATVPIYGLKIPFTANWSQSKVDQWKSDNCSSQERDSAENLNYYSAVYSVDPISAKAALECFDREFKAMTELAQASALRCTLTETPSAYVFEVKWRRTAGENGTAPEIVGLSTINTVCSGTESFAKGKFVSEGGIPILCSVSDKAAAFALTTSRGGCSASAAVRLPKLQIPKDVVLSEPLFLSGQEIEIAANAKIVTNGYPLSIRAERLSLLGPMKIVSFENAQDATPRPGRYAGNVQISASEFIGQGLTILNAGQNGGQGQAGQKGPPGTYGAPGEGRTTVQSRVCGNIPIVSNVCNLVPTGCQGGRNGGVGHPGQAGYPGMPGYAGGAAGEVVIDIPMDARRYISVLTNVGIDGQARACDGRICGGTGGPGGAGGLGGDGGPGGPGAPGTTYCGGTNAGPAGASGPSGPPGPTGPVGPHALVRI